MRARSIKPGLFKNEELADCPLVARYLFTGLWCMADREGRLEDRPRRIKIELLPYDDCDVNELLDTLQPHSIVRYSVNGNRYIQVLNFSKHQNPHVNERASDIPPPTDSDISTVQVPEDSSSNPSDSLSSDSLFSESLIKPSCRKSEHSDAKIFADDSLPMRLASHLRSCIEENIPNPRPANLQKWAAVIDRMIRLDKRDPDDIGYMIDWCQADEFWRTVILSATKLRDQWDQLYLKSKDDMEATTRERRRDELERRRN